MGKTDCSGAGEWERQFPRTDSESWLRAHRAMAQQEGRLRIACLSHLAMDRRLFQRPQQLMSAMAKRGHEIRYWGCIGWRRALQLWRDKDAEVACARFSSRLHTYSPFGGMARYFPRLQLTREVASFFRESSDPTNRDLVRVLWFYHPDFYRFADSTRSDIVVYDVMDRFRHFQSSQGSVGVLEQEAYRRADLIFAGGRTLAETVEKDLEKIGLCKPVFCYPSAVDFEHFGKALLPSTEMAPELATLKRPIIGYFGAVDERVDFQLLKEVATRCPAWSIVLIGPLLCQLPELPSNVHVLGARAYDILPMYLKGFDVCLLPFRRSELVQHISPTKTPEYLAGGRPVISTPVPDVIRDYGDIVSVVTTADEFIHAVESMVVSPPAPEILQSAARSRTRSWDDLAQAMEFNIFQLVQQKQT